eukprot:RCo019412
MSSPPQAAVTVRSYPRGLRPLLRRRCRSPDPTSSGYSIPLVIAEEVMGMQECPECQWSEEDLTLPRGPPSLRRRSYTPDPSSAGIVVPPSSVVRSPLRKSREGSPTATPPSPGSRLSWRLYPEPADAQPVLNEPRLVLLVLTEYFTNFYKVEHICRLAPLVTFHLLTAEPPRPSLDVSTLVPHTMRIPHSLLADRDENELFDASLAVLRSEGHKYDAVFTFGEDDVCLTARIANALELWGLPL